MGQCYARDIAVDDDSGGGGNNASRTQSHGPHTAARSSPGDSWPSPFSPGGVPAATPARPSPRTFFRRPFAPISPARHIKAALARRRLSLPPSPAPGGGGGGSAPEKPRPPLDKNFGYGKDFETWFELEKEIGRGHFGHTCSARVKRRPEIKEELVAVKIISKDKMATAVSIEDVRREVEILKGLSNHESTVKFYDAFEDAHSVYIVMELCEGGELLDRILSRGGSYSEEDAKGVIVQILNAVAFCHLQGVIHRDLKPENFLFTTGAEDAPLKMIDFGLSDFVQPDERLHDIVGSAYYVAPEVLHRSYSTEADMWSVGVITYILLSGSRPFWAQTESGIFRSVLRADPSFDVLPWPSVSPEAKDFIRKLLNKDYRKRMTAAQALAHPWLLEEHHRRIPLDILIYRLVRSYIRASAFKRAALKALSKALAEKELAYLRAQFNLLEPNRDGFVSFDNFKRALMMNATRVMSESRVLGILSALEPLTHRPMEFEEFCAAAVSPYQLEASETWPETSAAAFEHFEKEGNRVISVEELALEMNLTSVAHHMVQDWIRPADGKLNLLGYTKFLHGVTIRNSNYRSNDVRSEWI